MQCAVLPHRRLHPPHPRPLTRPSPSSLADVDRYSPDGRYVRTLHVTLANVKEAILRGELAADSSARAYIAASEAEAPR